MSKRKQTEEMTLEELSETQNEGNWDSAEEFFSNAEPLEEVPSDVAPMWAANLPAWVAQAERVFDAYHKEGSFVRQEVKAVALRLANVERGLEEMRAALAELDRNWAKAIADDE